MKNQIQKKQKIKRPPVIRVRMSFKDGKYALRKSVLIEKMGLLKSLDLPDNDQLSGAYIELLDKGGKVLYRTHFEDPNDPYVVISNDDGSFSHVKSRLDERHFEVLIPGFDQANSLHFFSSSNEKQTCREVFKLSYSQIKKSIQPKNRRK